MPKDFEKIRDALKRQHPDWPMSKVKERAAKITNARRKKEGRPPARFHVNKKRG